MFLPQYIIYIIYMHPVRKHRMELTNKLPERPFTPTVQQLEKAFNIITNHETIIFEPSIMLSRHYQ